jgi:hypothetical protein
MRCAANGRRRKRLHVPTNTNRRQRNALNLHSGLAPPVQKLRCSKWHSAGSNCQSGLTTKIQGPMAKPLDDQAPAACGRIWAITLAICAVSIVVRPSIRFVTIFTSILAHQCRLLAQSRATPTFQTAGAPVTIKTKHSGSTSVQPVVSDNAGVADGPCGFYYKLLAGGVQEGRVMPLVEALL